MQKLNNKINIYSFTVRTIGSLVLYIGLAIAILIPVAYYENEIIKISVVGILVFTVLLAAIFNFILPWFVYKLHGYEHNEDYVVIQKGVIFRRKDFIPIKRIQHIESFQGPIQALFKIHTVIIYTAGSNDMIVGISSKDVEPLIHSIRIKLQSYLDSEEAKNDAA